MSETRAQKLDLLERWEDDPDYTLEDFERDYSTLLQPQEVDAQERAWRQGFRAGWSRGKRGTSGSLTARNNHEDADCPYATQEEVQDD